MGSGKVLLGTSGWSYKEWIGPFYTKMDKSMLRAYTRVFNSVEIDSTFYRYPSKGTVMGWARYSPEGFVYVAKLPGLITHDKKLQVTQGIEQDLEKFIELMEPLIQSGKLGVILIQLPPRFDYEPKDLEAFLKLLPTHVRFAVEFRDVSWMRPETWSLLEKYRVAYTIVDEPLLPPELHLTTDIAYFRWHGKGVRPWYNYRYNREELEPWMPKVKEVSSRAEKVFGFFNNHYHGYAVENCLQVMEMLGPLDPKQLEAKSRIENYRKNSIQQSFSTLDVFAPPVHMSLENLISYLTAPARLNRAEQIKESELAIVQETGEHLEATIREYHIDVDLQNKSISHDCADWARVSSTKKFCKHMARLFLSIDRRRATEILKDIYDNEETWQFKPYVQS
jgi:uncharacterized protein YecE (DUF72 family)